MNRFRREWVVAATVLFLGSACGPSSKQESVNRGLEEYVRLARSVPTNQGDVNGSVWSEQAGYSDAFRDVKARRVADIVTVEVYESTSAVSEAATESSKNTEIDYSVPHLAGLEKSISELPTLASVSQSAEFAGEGSTSRKNVLSTTISARVLEVFPNRNLLIEGERQILVNGERQIVTLRGVVRPNDILANNTVLSGRIAEMELEVTGRGVVSNAQNPGILYKILTGVWPF